MYEFSKWGYSWGRWTRSVWFTEAVRSIQRFRNALINHWKSCELFVLVFLLQESCTSATRGSLERAEDDFEDAERHLDSKSSFFAKQLQKRAGKWPKVCQNLGQPSTVNSSIATKWAKLKPAHRFKNRTIMGIFIKGLVSLKPCAVKANIQARNTVTTKTSHGLEKVLETKASQANHITKVQ